ncbi:MAG: hypothetical protein ACJAUV_001818 [Flavobacteriales bacterium]|jgi:hypothetical protein
MRLYRCLNICLLICCYVGVSNNVAAQKTSVSEKVSLPLQEPVGTKYAAKSLSLHMGYILPIANINQHQSLFWNTGGFHLALVNQVALSKRLGFGYQLAYSRLYYGQTTNDSLGNTFYSDKAITSTNLIHAHVFIRLFLGKTYYQPSIDMGTGINYAFKTHITHEGTYVPNNASGELKYALIADQKFPINGFVRFNLKKLYLSFSIWSKPLFIKHDDDFQWKSQFGIGLRF